MLCTHLGLCYCKGIAGNLERTKTYSRVSRSQGATLRRAARSKSSKASLHFEEVNASQRERGWASRGRRAHRRQLVKEGPLEDPSSTGKPLTNDPLRAPPLISSGPTFPFHCLNFEGGIFKPWQHITTHLL